MKEVILYSAKWCGACKAMRHWFLNDIELDGVTFKYIDIEEEPNDSICGLPTIMFKENGIEVDRHNGAINMIDLVKRIRSIFPDLN